MKISLSLVLIAITSAIYSQNVIIPDSNFKNYLINNPAVNLNGDSEIQQSEATAFTGTLAFQFHLVNDLTGIEAFTNLTVLDCGDNNLTTLDLSANTALEQLYCYDNQISALDLSANLALVVLDCRDNQISNLDVSSNTALEYLNCPFNGMITLNVQNTALTTLRCYSNQFTNLNLSSVTSLNTLTCNFNQITELDLSNLSALTNLNCTYNDLSSLNVANGNNINITSFDARHNPNLNCIQVDDENFSNANWPNINGPTVFSEDCNLEVNEFSFLNQIKLYPNPVSDVLYFSSEDIKVEKIYLYSMSGQTILVSDNILDSIDVSNLIEGLYFIEVSSSDGKSVQKFIKN